MKPNSRAVILVALALALLSWLAVLTRLRFVSERSALLDPKDPHRLLEEAYARDFPLGEDLVLVISGGTTQQRQEYVDTLLQSWKGHPDLPDCWGKTSVEPFRKSALFYLSVEQLRQIGDIRLGRTDWVESLLPTLEKSLRTGQPFEVNLLQGIGEGLPPSLSRFLKPGSFVYNELPSASLHLILIRPGPNLAATRAAVQQEIVQQRKAFPGITAGLTGRTAVEQDEMAGAQRDALHSIGLAGAAILLVFCMSFSDWKRPLALFFSLALALSWTLGAVAVLLGHLNLLTVTVASILLGLGADFGNHILLSYEERCLAGQPPRLALLDCLRQTGVKTSLGALASMLAFLAICLTDFRGIVELGGVAAMGIALCLLAMVTVFPALLLELPPPKPRRPPLWCRWLANLLDLLLAWPRAVCVAALLFSLASLSVLPKVNFDQNLLNLQDPRLDSVVHQIRLLQAGQGVLSALSVADSPQQARQRSEQFAGLSTVARVDSLLTLLPPEGASKEQEVKKLLTHLRQLQVPPVQPSSSQRRRLEGLASRYGPGPLVDRLQAAESQLKEQLRFWKELLACQQEQPLTLAGLPESLRSRGLGLGGKLAIRIYPKRNLWEPEAMAEFVAQVQSVDKDVRGLPVSMHFHVIGLRRAFGESGKWALLAVALVLLLYFRQPRLTFLALFPKLLGILWMIGVMGMLGWNFNPVNFVALPMILGIGLVFGVHVLHAVLERPQENLFRQSTGPAVALSAFTTMAGFASLCGAAHQGIASLGCLMTLGVAVNLITSALVLPCLLRLGSRTDSYQGP